MGKPSSPVDGFPEQSNTTGLGLDEVRLRPWSGPWPASAFRLRSGDCQWFSMPGMFQASSDSAYSRTAQVEMKFF